MDEAHGDWLLKFVSFVIFSSQRIHAPVDRDEADEAGLPEDRLLHSLSFPVEMKPLASSII